VRLIIPDRYNSIKLSELPHVVILGAGASCAATPEGEKNSQRLPSMNQLPNVLKLSDILTTEQIKAAEMNFEGFFDSLMKDELFDISKTIEDRLYAYFESIEIADHITLYDKIVLSLRKKDIIATFNWDPLLAYAYRRHGHLKILPAILFLHGNVKQGVCNVHKRLGWNDDLCDVCREPMKRTKLLYPVSNKDYSHDPIIREQWNILDHYLDEAYFITVFGYSAPYTDIDARSRIIDHIANNRRKGILQVELIDLKSDELSKTTFKDIYANHHCSLLGNFDQSWLSKHPRFSCEALYEATMQQKPIQPIPFPKTDSIEDFREWVEALNNKYPEFYKEGNPKQG
jgi:hypothetical protein